MNLPKAEPVTEITRWLSSSALPRQSSVRRRRSRQLRQRSAWHAEAAGVRHADAVCSVPPIGRNVFLADQRRSPMIELSEGTMDRLVLNGRALSTLYKTHATIAIQDRPSVEPWLGFAFCLLARAHHAFESALVLSAREADCAALVRVQFEHTLVFAWLLMDGPTHYARLLKGEFEERRKMGQDLAEHGLGGLELSEELMTAAMRADGFDPGASGPPKLVDMALAADEHWRLRFRQVWVPRFRHGYATLYRSHSTHVHPRLAGLKHFFPRSADDVGKSPRRDPLRLDCDAVVVLFEALLVASAGLGWPPAPLVLFAAFDGLPTDSPR